jgi:PAS domain-containing protein
MTERLRGNAAVLILRVPKLGEIPMKVAHGAMPEREALYFKHFMAVDPFVQLPRPRGYDARLRRRGELERSEYFREWLVPMDMVYAIGVDIRDRNRYHVRLRICRPRRAGNFSADDCAVVEMFVPHLKTAIHLFAELEVVRTERSIYADAMDQLTLATIVLDENGRVLHANRLADTILAERDGITLVNDALQLANHDDAKRFRELISRAVAAQRASKAGLVEVMRVRRPSGQPTSARSASLELEYRRPRRTTDRVGCGVPERRHRGRARACAALRSDPEALRSDAEGGVLALRLAAAIRCTKRPQRSASVRIRPVRTCARSSRRPASTVQAKLVRVLLKSVAMPGSDRKPIPIPRGRPVRRGGALARMASPTPRHTAQASGTRNANIAIW